MTPKNAASVLPEPVGALINVCVPPPIASHALSCTLVGGGESAAEPAGDGGVEVLGSMGVGLT